jgi:hypothetical protein
MALIKLPLALGAAILLAALQSRASAALFTADFETDTTANWTVNNNGVGTNAANFFFDYSGVGIPSAPNSAGGTTRGLKLGANLDPATAPATGIPGISVSPTGQSFTGNYDLTFDWWSNYIGPLGVGATGSTTISTYGILTSGTTANFPGTADGVWFAATGDGQSAADYRIYSSERNVSYQIPPTAPEDAHAVHLAGSRNNTAALYLATFPGGAAAPGSQAALPTQTGTTSAGAAGFRWNPVRISKLGNLITWSVNGAPLATVDTTSFTTPTGGTNILFGMSDINSTTNSSAALLEQLQFTLIDNVQVTVPEPVTASLLGLAMIGMLGVSRRRFEPANRN